MWYRSMGGASILTALWVAAIGWLLASAAPHSHHYHHRAKHEPQPRSVPYNEEATYYDEDDPLIVMTSKGPVRGFTQEAASGKLVDVFLGIPYAQAPVGKYRFKHPIPTEPWKEVFNATQMPYSCYQTIDEFFGDFQGSQMWNANTNMSEDCLTMLLWVPRPRPINAAVLVWVYGGGFYSGTASLAVYDGRTLASEENVIVVSFNYRVANLGFLYLDHQDAPGNAGMHDQVMALRWIQENIRAFGGNPKNVTLFGESAGSVSVSMHLLSPLSRDLFSQAIMQSGTATANWAINTREKAISYSLKLAESVKCPYTTLDHKEEVLQCLRDADPKTLVESEWGEFGIVDFPFIPIVDGVFLTESPEESLATKNFKKCRILLGSNRDEGTYFIIYFLTDYFRRDDNVYISRTEFENSVKTIYSKLGKLAQEAIIFEYTDWLNPDDPIKNRDAVDKIVGDYHFTCPVVQWADVYASAGIDTYQYHFTHRSSQNLWPEWLGVIHADEIAYIFGEPLNRTWSYRAEEVQLSKRFMRYWANFAKTGNPSLAPDGNWESIYWPTHTAFGKEYLTLAINSSQVGYGHRAKQCAFWEKFLPQLVNNNGTQSGQMLRVNCTSGASSHHFLTHDSTRFFNPSLMTIVILLVLRHY